MSLKGGVLTLSFLLFLFTTLKASADPITGCLKGIPKTLYNVQIGETPSGLCNFGDQALTWSQEGPPGPAGSPGADGADGEQGPAGPAGTPSFILKDSNGQQVGTVITVNGTQTIFALGELQVDRRSVLTRLEFMDGLGNTIPVGMTIDSGQIQFQHRVYFQTNDCTGDGFMPEVVAAAGFGPAFYTSAVVGKNGPGGERSLYVPVNEAPVSRSFDSVSVFGTCQGVQINLPQSSVHAELLDPNLHLTFPPGYTLELP